MSDTTVKAVLCDLDGTLTDGMYHVDGAGMVSKSFHTRDMHALCRLSKSGVFVAVVTGSSDDCNGKKFAAMGCDIDLFENVHDKSDFVRSFCAIHGIDASDCLFIGDGENDIDAMMSCGHRACPSDASPLVIELDNMFVSSAPGGRGAVEHVLMSLFA